MVKRIQRLVYLISIGLLRLVYWTKPVGRENIPAGGCLICPNHTANADSISVVLGLGITCNYAAMAKAELFKNPIVGAYLRAVQAFPVNRGGSDMAAIRLGTKCIKEGKKLLLFPEGTRMKDGKLGKAKPGAGMFSLRTGAPIVPVYITPGKKFLRRTVVRFGTPFVPEREGDSHTEIYQHASDQVMERIAGLAEEGKIAQ